MTIETRGSLTVLTADEGKLLTDGQTCGTTIYLGKHDSASNWREVDSFAEDATADVSRVETLEAENKTMKAQLEAATEVMDFHEELIAEMAEIVYA